jgi:hypothetical protein
LKVLFHVLIYHIKRDTQILFCIFFWPSQPRLRRVHLNTQRGWG